MRGHFPRRDCPRTDIQADLFSRFSQFVRRRSFRGQFQTSATRSHPAALSQLRPINCCVGAPEATG